MPADGIGAPVLRTEDRPLLTGDARFVADLPASGALEVVFVRSFIAHGELNGVHVRDAAAMPGVVRVMTAEDVRALPSIPLPPRFRIPESVVRPLLADGRVRFAGEAVAAIAADSLAHALDAAELVEVDVDPLPAVADAAEAAEADAPELFPGHRNVLEEVTFGDAPEGVAFRDAPVTVELDVVHRRLTPAPIETRRLLIDPDGDRLTVWCSHQSPHRLRDNLAAVFGLAPANVRVIAPNVGGAFGGKSQTWPEYVVVAHLAWTLGRRVRWIEGRSESFSGASHGRAQRHRVRLAADRDGTFRALDVRIDADLGAYPHTGAPIASNTAWVMSGPYRIPSVSVAVRGIVTNTTPIAAVRGAGRPEAAFSLERAVDELAKRIGVDPADVRRRNLIPAEAFPYGSPTGATYDSGDYRAALDLACELAGYDDVRAAQRTGASEGSTLVGIGIGCYIERSGEAAMSAEFGSVAVDADGGVTVRTGSSSQGQGHATALAQVAASALDLPLTRIHVHQGDTDKVPTGSGTFASRSIQVGGAAVQRAAADLLAGARLAAADLLEVEPDDLRYAEGAFSVVGSPSTGVTLGAVAAAKHGLAAGGTSETPQAFPYGTCIAVVEVDTSTGRVTLRRIVSVDDCGTVVNPTIVEGQVHGSLVQGIGQALFEELPYDTDAQPLTTSLIDYGMPSAAEIPRLEIASTVVPSGSGIGAKGTGEAGSIGAPPAIVNAVADALRSVETRDLSMPLTPERVWQVCRRRVDEGRAPDREAS